MTFPNMSEAFSDWSGGITLRVASKVNVEGEIFDKPVTDVVVQGVLQPIPQRKLMVKPEGQRNWKWYTFWTETLLQNDMILIDADGKTYRVMNDSDWTDAGYYEYELTQGVDA